MLLAHKTHNAVLSSLVSIESRKLKLSWFLKIFDRLFFKSLNRVRDDRYF